MINKNKATVGTVVALCVSILWLFPLLLIFINSFKSNSDIMNHFLSLPKQWNLKNYIETWTNFNFPQLIVTTLLYTAATVAGVVLTAPMAAHYLVRHDSRLTRACFLLIILPIMVPFQSYMITLTRIMGNVHLNNTRLGYILVSIGLSVPLAVFMIYGFVKTVPIELEESARIDGAGAFVTYFRIVLPLLIPILTTVIVIDALATWNDVIVNQILIGSNATSINMQNALYMQFSSQASDWPHALPGTVISMLPSLIFFVIMQKYVISGATEGAVKG